MLNIHSKLISPKLQLELRPELQLERYDQNCPLVAAVSAVRLLTFGKLWQSLHLEFTC